MPIFRFSRISFRVSSALLAGGILMSACGGAPTATQPAGSNEAASAQPTATIATEAVASDANAPITVWVDSTRE